MQQLITTNPLVLILLSLWVLPWKGIALWKAANKKQKWWFIALLVINTLGILEILYIYVFSVKNNKIKNEIEGQIKKATEEIKTEVKKD